MAVDTPVKDGGSGPIDVGVVKLEPRDSQNDRSEVMR